MDGNCVDEITSKSERKAIEKAMVFGNENVSLQDSFSKFLDRKKRERQILKKCNGGLGIAQGRSQQFKDALREKFIAKAKSYLGVPYAERFKAPDAPVAPLYLDCCGLVRQVLIDLQSDFGFVTGRWNQAYQIDTLPIVLTREELKPGDLIFYEGKYTNVQGRSKPQKHDMVHVEIFLGGETGDATIGARFFKGVVTIFPSSQFKSTTWDLVKCHYRSIDTWLDGECKSHCAEHPWVSDMWKDAAGKKSIFSSDEENEDCDATNFIADDSCIPCTTATAIAQENAKSSSSPLLSTSAAESKHQPQTEEDDDSLKGTSPRTAFVNVFDISPPSSNPEKEEVKENVPSSLQAKEKKHHNNIRSNTTALLAPKASAIDTLLNPHLVPFLDFSSLTSLLFVSKDIHQSLTQPDDPLGYYIAICSSYSKERGLYLPEDKCITSQAFKKYFFNELLLSKCKWTEQQDQQDIKVTFKVRVSGRMRPGEMSDDSVQLPLHQFLKIKRRQQLAGQMNNDNKNSNNNSNNNTNSSSSLLVGEKIPDEFVDPLLGITMREPVLLKTSGRIVDNSVALQCILRGARDPFNGKKMTQAMIIPQPELAKQIEQWLQTRKTFEDVKVNKGDAKTLLDDAMIDPVLLEAIMEAERLAELAKKEGQGVFSGKSGGGRSSSVDDSSYPHLDVDEGENGAVANHNFYDNNSNLNDMVINGDNANTNEQHGDDAEISKSVDAESDLIQSKKVLQSAKVIEISPLTSVIAMHVPGAGVRPFNFSTVNDGNSSQEQVYVNTTKDLVASAMNGFNSCVLCYGQTGSGKTHTFFGPNNSAESISNMQADFGSDAGLVVRTLNEVMNAKMSLKSIGINMSVVAQFIEIYDEQVHDLINGNNVLVRIETGELVGAHDHHIDSLARGIEILNLGNARKKFSSTAMNDRSSRSHTAFILHISQRRDESRIHQHYNNNYADTIVKSTIHLVDLAGSERIKKSNAHSGALKKEAVGINSSLLVLGKVIAALVEGKSHVPYLESKLTTMLRPAFGGNSRTSVIINCRMEDTHGDETLQSLRFGERCAMISNSAKQAATSLAATLESMDKAMEVIKSQIDSFQKRKLTHLESYGKILKSFDQLKNKRDLLVRSVTKKVSS